MITEYASYDSVRAVLGVSPEEVEDATLDLPLYEVLLKEDLLDLSSTIDADYNTAKELASPTAIETRFVQVMQTYASYQIAYTLLGAAPMFAPKDIKDGKAGVVRVSDPFKGLETSIVQAMSYIRTRLLAAYETYSPTNVAPVTVTRRLLAGVTLGTDPVTG